MSQATTPSPAEEASAPFPGARAPDRTRAVSAHGQRIAVCEWGAADAPVLLLAHGGFDFAGTFDVFAPLLADGGWRVVSWDHRGHGDSQHAQLYSWEADVRDALAVLDSASRWPVVAVGHSKGGGVTLQLVQALPERFTHYVCIDGLPASRPRPDVADHERGQILAETASGWLDHRRRIAGLVRRPGTPDDLARRRGRMNPRLSHEWLRYLVSVGARRDPDGWRWKLDPQMRFGGFGPWRPSWTLDRLSALRVPMLLVLGTAQEPMSMGTTPENVRPFLPKGTPVETFDAGHFVHVEKPREVARAVLRFLAS